MIYNSFIDWLDEVKKLPFKDIILGVKDTITPETLYIYVSDTKNVKMDNFQWTIGYTYSVVISVSYPDSTLLSSMAPLLQDGLTFSDWSESSQLYNYTGTVYLASKTGGDPFE